MLGTLPLFPLLTTAAGATSGPARGASRLSEAQVLLGVLGVVILLLAGLAVLTVVRRMGRRTLGEASQPTGRIRRVPRSPWSEAGKRARPVDEEGNLPDDDEPRDKDDLEETH